MRVLCESQKVRGSDDLKNLGSGGLEFLPPVLFCGGGVGGIYSVATLPEARGKGVGVVLTLNPLLYACEEGYRIGVLQSSEMGSKVFERLGFWHLCLVECFYLSIGKSDRGSRA